MRHSANELIYTASILAPDGVTVLAENVRCGIRAFPGRRQDEAQLTSSETPYVFSMYYLDGSLITDAGYLLSDGVLYIVDCAPVDPREPRAGMWLEINCHIERMGQ